MPGQPGSGSPRRKARHDTPFGIRTASPPRCSTSVRRAYSDTAIRALTFSRAVCSSGDAALITRDRSLEVWKVPTMGPSATQQAITLMLGAEGSCTCRTSKRPSRIQRRTRAVERGPNFSRATEPLYFTGTLPPADTA